MQKEMLLPVHRIAGINQAKPVSWVSKIILMESGWPLAGSRISKGVYPLSPYCIWRCSSTLNLKPVRLIRNELLKDHSFRRQVYIRVVHSSYFWLQVPTLLLGLAIFIKSRFLWFIIVLYSKHYFYFFLPLVENRTPHNPPLFAYFI